MFKSLTHVVQTVADWLTHTSLNTISVEQCNATGREEGWMLVSSDGAGRGQLQLRSTGGMSSTAPGVDRDFIVQPSRKSVTASAG